MTAHIILIRLPDCVTPVKNKGGESVHSGGSEGIWKCSWWATPSLRSTGTLPVHCAIGEDFWGSTNFGPFWFTPELKPKSFVLNLLRCCPKGQSGSPSSPRHAGPSYRKPHECTPCTRAHQRTKHSLIGPVKKKKKKKKQLCFLCFRTSETQHQHVYNLPADFVLVQQAKLCQAVSCSTWIELLFLKTSDKIGTKESFCCFRENMVWLHVWASADTV